MDLISKIPENPADGGFSTESFRAEFDKAGNLLKEYINKILIPELDKTVDVDALIKSILDETLTAPEKAAPAKVVGDIIKKLAVQEIVSKTFERTIRSGDFVLDYDQNLRAQMITGTKARVFGGAYVTQGNYVELNVGSYVDLNLQSGSLGLYRNDLICARYQRNADGIVTNSVVVIAGNPTQTNSVDPTILTGNINKWGAVVHDTPIARVKYSGTSVSIENIIERQSKRRSATLTASNWSSSAPYTQSITVEGLSDGVNAKAYPQWPEALADKLALGEETVKIRSCERSGSTMTFQCWEDKPVLDIPIIVEVYV